MTTFRPYRSLVSIKEACNELRRGSGSRFDPDIVEAFVQAREASAGLD
jgi:HD-GYP domain-containing protein (c-di-GMP phosphodiesterase class II)